MYGLHSGNFTMNVSEATGCYCLQSMMIVYSSIMRILELANTNGNCTVNISEFVGDRCHGHAVGVVARDLEAKVGAWRRLAQLALHDAGTLALSRKAPRVAVRALEFRLPAVSPAFGPGSTRYDADVPSADQ